MMKKILGVMAVVALGAAAGCGNSDNGCGDGACLDSSITTPDGGGSYDGATPYALSRGTTTFKISGVTGITDGCGFKPGEVVGDNITVTYDDTTQTVTIGKPVGTPATPFFGSGKVAATTVNTAMMLRENDVGSAGATCTWHEKVTSIFQLYANDKFTLTPTLADSNYSAGCTAMDKPGGATCTSTWTWTVEK